jgi:predicted nucleic-acid-binding protein
VNALDTNILVRFLVRDDVEQADRVYWLFKTAEEEEIVFFVSIPVLLELIKVLDSAYEIPRYEILDVLEELLLFPCLVFDARSDVRSFIADARNNNLELSTLLLAFDAVSYGCEQVLTFDKTVANSDFFTLLEK